MHEIALSSPWICATPHLEEGLWRGEVDIHCTTCVCALHLGHLWVANSGGGWEGRRVVLLRRHASLCSKLQGIERAVSSFAPTAHKTVVVVMGWGWGVSHVRLRGIYSL